MPPPKPVPIFIKEFTKAVGSAPPRHPIAVHDPPPEKHPVQVPCSGVPSRNLHALSPTDEMLPPPGFCCAARTKFPVILGAVKNTKSEITSVNSARIVRLILLKCIKFHTIRKGLVQ